MEIWLKVRDATITESTFMTDGCGTTIAAGSMVTELAKGKTVIQAQKISQQDVLSALGGLPEESQHCALLAANTLREAIKDYLAFKNEPWKRAYRRQ
jgi:nitrogen fixation NifU-like protein